MELELGCEEVSEALVPERSRLTGPYTLDTVQQVTQAQATARTFEHVLLSTVRRHLKAFDQKVAAHLEGMQRQADAALSKVVERLTATERLQMRCDQRLAELNGSCQGLSEEVQAQARRAETVEHRAMEGQLKLEEEFRQRCVDLDLNIQKAAGVAQARAEAIEDGLALVRQRVQRLEVSSSEGLAFQEMTEASLQGLAARLHGVELRMAVEADAAVAARAQALDQENADAKVGVAMCEILEKPLADIAAKVEQVFQDTFECQSQLTSQDLQMQSLRTLINAREEQFRHLSDRLERDDWDGKLNQVRKAGQEESLRQASRIEHMEVAVLHLETQEKDCQERLEQCEARRAELFSEIEAVREDKGVAPQVSALVGQLRAIVPKVLEQEKAIKELRAQAQIGEDVPDPMGAGAAVIGDGVVVDDSSAGSGAAPPPLAEDPPVKATPAAEDTSDRISPKGLQAHVAPQPWDEGWRLRVIPGPSKS